MKKRRILLLALLALLLTVSGKAEEDSMPFVTAVKIEESEMEEGQSREDFSENSAERNASGEAASQQSLSEKIAMEISNAEEREKAGGSRHTAGEMYQLWDDTLNTVWRLLEENLSKADMEVLRNETGLHPRTRKFWQPGWRMRAEACSRCWRPQRRQN